MKTISVEKMKQAERAADERGESSSILMERAGYGLYRFIQQRFGQMESKEIIGLVGSGNNGGDTLMALSHLCQNGWRVKVVLFNRRAENDSTLQDLIRQGAKLIFSERTNDFQEFLGGLWQAGLILDGILGTGIHLPLRETIASPMQEIQARLAKIYPRPMVLAVDCPSGIDCDSGEYAPETLQADLTLCLGAVKKGLVASAETLSTCGEIEGIDIGIDDLIPESVSLFETITQDDVFTFLPARNRSGHKGTFGKALIIAGSVNYTGAAFLAASGALRSGVGWVTLAVPADLQPILAGMIPEATWLLLSSEMGVISQNALPVIRENLSKYQSVLIGCGLGLEKTTAQFLNGVLHHGEEAGRSFGFISQDPDQVDSGNSVLPALILDADGLKLLVQISHWEEALPRNSILTPHPGELAILTGLPVEEIQKDRMEVAQRYAKKWKQVIVLKGPGTIIAAPDGRCAMIPIATTALAHAGTGDVLAGVITSLRAQGMDAYQAAIAGVWIHARAGTLAEHTIGCRCTLAGDLPSKISAVLQRV